MPESEDSMSALILAAFFFSPRDASPIRRRRDMVTAIKTGRMQNTTSASRHSTVNITASAPRIVRHEISRSSGP